MFVTCKIFDDGYSYQREVIPLICISLIVMTSIFSCTYWPSVCLWRNVCLGLLPIFYWVVLVFLLLIYMSYFCILEIKPLLVSRFVNIFYQSVGGVFILLMVSFAVQKF